MDLFILFFYIYIYHYDFQQIKYQSLVFCQFEYFLGPI